MSSFMELEEVKKLQIPLQDLSLATKQFHEENIIGKGGYGKVYCGVLPQFEPRSVAIKRLDRTSGQGEREFMMEIALLSSYSHENLVSLIGFCDEDGEKILIYEYASNGSLDKSLHSKDLTWIRRLEICLGAARGLKYLHHDAGTQHRVIHRDIKSANILLDENWKAKVSDFGLSKISPANIHISLLFTNPCGTQGYADPRYITTGTLTKESDVFSFGVVLFEVLCSRQAFIPCDDERGFLYHWARQHYEQKRLDEIIDPNLQKQVNSASLSTFSTIAYRCINEGRKERPTMIVVVEELEKTLNIHKKELGETLPQEAQARERSLYRRSVLSRDSSYWFNSYWSGDKWKLEIFGIEEVESGEERKSEKLDETSRIEALDIEWKGNGEDTESNTDEDVTLQGLTAHLELKVLKMTSFKGIKFSSWIFSNSVSLLQNLVKIWLDGCDRCEQVPTLGHLPNLEKVEMTGLKKVRKMGEEFYHYHNYHEEGHEVINEGKLFFPALRELTLENMDMLEEWVDVKQMYPLGCSSLSQSKLTNQAFQFPNLEKLQIFSCPNLISVPCRFPSLKKLSLCYVDNERLELQKLSTGLTCLTDLDLMHVHCEVDDTLEDLFKNNNRSLTNVHIDNCIQLTKLPKRLFTDCLALKKFRLEGCDNIEVIPDVGRESPSISRQDLQISSCGRLRVLPSGIDDDILLPSLRSLEIYDYHLVMHLPDLGRLTGLMSLTIGGFSDEVIAEIPTLPSSLQTLMLWKWPEVQQLPQQRLNNLSALTKLSLYIMEGLEALPEWLLNLPSLQELDIYDCRNLKSMPTAEATRCLKSLKIDQCPVLGERCVKGNGADWPNIQHIPFIEINSITIQNIRSDSSSVFSAVDHPAYVGIQDPSTSPSVGFTQCCIIFKKRSKSCN